MKKIVVWLCRGYKSGNRCIHGYRCLCRQADGKSSLGASSRRRYSRSSCCSAKVGYLQTQILWILFYGTLKNLDWTLRRDTLEILRMHLVQIEFEKGENLMSEILARPVRRNNHLRKPHDKEVEPGRVEWNLARKDASSKPNIKLRFILLWRRQKHRRSYVYCAFGSFNAQSCARRFELRYNGYFEEVQKPHMRLTATGCIGNKRVNTSFCSWSRSVRNSAITRWNASDSIASAALTQNADIQMSGKRRNFTSWPKMGIQLIENWTTQYFSLYQDCHHIPAAFCLQHQDQRISLLIPENWEHYQIQCRLEVTSMHGGNRWWQMMTSRPRRTVNQHTRWTRKIQRKAFLFGYSPSQLI